MAQKSTVSLDDILSALQTIVVSQNDITSRLAALENGTTVKTAPTASQPTVTETAKPARQRAARRENAAQKNTAPKAPAGTLTGTVVRIARGGYGLLVNVDGAEQWANAPAKGKNNKKLPALFKDMQPGQTVTLTLDEFARVMPESVTASATPAVQTPEPAVQTPEPAVKSDTLNGDHLVTLVKFDSKKSGMVMLHNLTDFAGVGKNAGKGRWVTDIDAAVYADMLAYNLNDRILVSLADGRLIRAERVSSIEKETGIVTGVQNSGKQTPPAAQKSRRDEKVVAARKTASRSGARQTKPVYKCSGTAQHRTTCFGRCVNAA